MGIKQQAPRVKNKNKNHDLPAPKSPHPPSKSPTNRPQHTFPLPSQIQKVAIVNFLDCATYSTPFSPPSFSKPTYSQSGWLYGRLELRVKFFFLGCETPYEIHGDFTYNFVESLRILRVMEILLKLLHILWCL